MRTIQKHLFTVLAAAFTGIGMLSALPAGAETDIDGDGLDDLLVVTQGTSNLQWKSLPSSAGGRTIDVAFGGATDRPVPAAWLEPGQLSIASVGLNDRGRKLEWQILQTQGDPIKRTFGRAGDYFVTGADFDGDGIADAAVITVGKRNRIRWTIRYGFALSEKPRGQRVTFGKVGGRLVYLNPLGTEDWMGITSFDNGRKNAKLTLRKVGKKDEITVKGLPKALLRDLRPRPFPVKGPEGSDVFAVAFERSDNTEVQVFDLQGTKFASKTFPGKGTVLVGEYDSSSGGDEILFINGNFLASFNPFNQNYVESTFGTTGTAIDTYRIQRLETPTPAPTAAPTVVPTVTPTATVTPKN